MTTITYCRRWNPILKEPAEVLQPGEAEKLHRLREPYTAVLEQESSRIIVVEMCFYEAYCHVLFLDDRRRVANRYSFVETSDSRLFLEEAAVHNYSDGSERASNGEVYVFRQDGTVLSDTGRAGGPINRSEGNADVSRNFAAPPVFGDYTSVVTRER